MMMVEECLTTGASQTVQVNVHGLEVNAALVEVAATSQWVAIPLARGELAVGPLQRADSMRSLMSLDGDRLGVLELVVLLLVLLLELRCSHRPHEAIP